MEAKTSDTHVCLGETRIDCKIINESTIIKITFKNLLLKPEEDKEEEDTLYIRHVAEKWKFFSNLFSKNVTFTKFFSKKVL